MASQLKSDASARLKAALAPFKRVQTNYLVEFLDSEGQVQVVRLSSPTISDLDNHAESNGKERGCYYKCVNLSTKKISIINLGASTDEEFVWLAYKPNEPNPPSLQTIIAEFEANDMSNVPVSHIHVNMDQLGEQGDADEALPKEIDLSLLIKSKRYVNYLKNGALDWLETTCNVLIKKARQVLASLKKGDATPGKVEELSCEKSNFLKGVESLKDETVNNNKDNDQAIIQNIIQAIDNASGNFKSIMKQIEDEIDTLCPLKSFSFSDSLENEGIINNQTFTNHHPISTGPTEPATSDQPAMTPQPTSGTAHPRISTSAPSNLPSRSQSLLIFEPTTPAQPIASSLHSATTTPSDHFTVFQDWTGQTGLNQPSGDSNHPGLTMHPSLSTSTPRTISDQKEADTDENTQLSNQEFTASAKDNSSTPEAIKLMERDDQQPKHMHWKEIASEHWEQNDLRGQLANTNLAKDYQNALKDIADLKKTMSNMGYRHAQEVADLRKNLYVLREKSNEDLQTKIIQLEEENDIKNKILEQKESGLRYLGALVFELKDVISESKKQLDNLTAQESYLTDQKNNTNKMIINQQRKTTEVNEENELTASDSTIHPALVSIPSNPISSSIITSVTSNPPQPLKQGTPANYHMLSKQSQIQAPIKSNLIDSQLKSELTNMLEHYGQTRLDIMFHLSKTKDHVSKLSSADLK